MILSLAAKQSNLSTQSVVQSISHTQSDTDSQDFTLDQQSYSKLIDYMNTLTPFEAIRYAAEINKMNGFEVVSRVEIAEWKEAAKHFEKIKISESIFQKSKVGNLTIEKSKCQKRQNDFSVNEIVKKESENIKASTLQKAYMTMLSV